MFGAWYVNIDARVKPLKAVRDKLALELLYHGGLAAERLGLEGGDFYEGIRRLYGQLPIQSMSSSSFKDSIVPVPNLVAMTELNDGSPAEQGSSPQGESPNPGDRLYLGFDLQRSRPDHERRYVARGRDGGSVKPSPPLQVLHVVGQNPHAHCPRSKEAGDGDQCIKPRMRDRHRLLVAEPCGDYGCLPPLEAMGTAWRPSTLNSVEHVTARIRNGIEILAALAGMPQVSAVHIHSNPASYTYNLRPEYNVVMTQALNEADAKGLTTVCIDALAQFLVFSRWLSRSRHIRKQSAFLSVPEQYSPSSRPRSGGISTSPWSGRAGSSLSTQ